MRIALAQIVTGRDVAANLDKVEQYAADAADAGASLVVFPEATMRAFGNSLVDVAEPVEGAWAARVREIAASHSITIVAGMFAPGSDGRVINTLLVAGREANTEYDKIHLYDAFGFKESDTVEAGDGPVTFTLEGITFGLTTCYDVRFPGLYVANADAGAQVNIVSASWGAGPGKNEQWDLLVRARALDSTTYVLAAGQGDPATLGIDNPKNAPTGIGHSAVISPLGEVLKQAGGDEELLVADIDPDVVRSTRDKLPVLANRRL